MEDILSINFVGSDKYLLARLRGGLANRVMANVSDQLAQEASDLRDYIVNSKLSGQVLNRVSGALADSVKVTTLQTSSTKASFQIQAGGPSAPYGAYFESGGVGSYIIEPVEKQVLAWSDSEGATIFAKRVVHPAIPRKQFLGTSVQERRSTILRNLREAILNA